MTVNPGWGGQPFIASSPDKVERLRETAATPGHRGRRRHRPRDGRSVADAGATLFVAGSAVFGAADPGAAYREIAAAAGAD